MPLDFEPYPEFLKLGHVPDLQSEVIASFRVVPAEGFTAEDIVLAVCFSLFLNVFPFANCSQIACSSCFAGL